MALEHAILGFLSYEPMTGYDLKKRFDRSVRHFWSANQSQIYRTLKRMADDGWVRIEVIPQEDLPARKVHHLTDAGREALLGWLTSDAGAGMIRNEWLVQVFFADRVSPDHVTELLQGRAEQLTRAAEVLRKTVPPVIEGYAAEMDDDRSKVLWELTLDYGLSRMEWELSWIQSKLEERKG